MLFISLLLMIMSLSFSIFHLMNSLLAMRDNVKSENGFQHSKKPISILIPCYNEAGILQTTINGIKHTIHNYPNAECVFINDGSTDDTISKLSEMLSLKPYMKKMETSLHHEPIIGMYVSSIYSNIYVIDKYNGGKADALNAGIMFANHEIVVTLDADTILDKDALHHINDAFEDKQVIAAGGNVNIIQAGTGKRLCLQSKLMIRLQVLEYLKGFLLLKPSQARANALSIISGAFGAFRKHVLLDVGGYRNTVGEDIDVTLKCQKYTFNNKGTRIVFLPQAMSYTECPDNWKDLYNQRVRWQKAFIDCLIRYFKELCATSVTKSVSFFFMFESFLIGVIASSFTFLYLLYSLVINYSDESLVILLIYLFLSVTLHIFHTITGLYIAKRHGIRFKRNQVFRLFTTVLTELLVYRFICLFFVIIGSIAYFFKKDGWNKVVRTGYKYLETETDSGAKTN